MGNPVGAKMALRSSARVQVDVHTLVQKAIRFSHSAAFYSDVQYLLGFFMLLRDAGMALKQQQL